MIICKGKSVQNGIVMGKIHIYEKRSFTINQIKIDNPEEELRRLDQSVAGAVNQLESFYKEALEKVGEKEAEIFQVHKMMIQDEDFINDIRDLIRGESINAEYAVEKIGKKYEKEFASMEDEYMRARSEDVKDISTRIIELLRGEKEEEFVIEEPVIIVADDLSPSETIKMDKSKILGFVLKKGSTNSHTAILARSMNLPSLVSTSLEGVQIANGQTAIIDGFQGRFILEADAHTQGQMEEMRIKWLEEFEELQVLKGKEDITTGGKKIKVLANISSLEDLEGVLESDASGIGLFRTEFLYMGRDSQPSEEEQYENYRSLLSRMKDKKVIIRTLDIGADKKVDYLHLEEEENPALGYRGIRICLDRQNIFKTQLKAIYRASSYGNVGIMFPMIISKEEVLAAKEIINQVKEELKREDIPMGEVEIGVMIETPAAALISDELAHEVDFFSLGTNDLTQYTLAVDRQNQKLQAICDNYHPAVLKLIKMTVENGHKGGAWVGVCGELASDLNMTETFVQLGVDELSVSPSKVLELRKKIRSI